MDNIDNADADFQPLTLRRSAVPPYTPTARYGTGYTHTLAVDVALGLCSDSMKFNYHFKCDSLHPEQPQHSLQKLFVFNLLKHCGIQRSTNYSHVLAIMDLDKQCANFLCSLFMPAAPPSLDMQAKVSMLILRPSYQLSPVLQAPLGESAQWQHNNRLSVSLCFST